MLKNNKMLILMIGVFILLTDSAAAYNIKDYYPLEQNNSWTYAIIADEGRYEQTVKIEGTEIVEDVETIKIAYANNEYGYVISDLEGIKMYKHFEGEDYDLFNPPKVIFPNLEISETKSYSINVITYNLKGEKINEYDEAIQIKFKSFEDIEVPAGKFSNCLKFSSVLRQHEKNGNYEEDNCDVWLAKNVGVVKKNCISIEYDAESKQLEIHPETHELIFSSCRWQKTGGH